jgi:3-hydroxyisobutyrate dehydrogenase-like beta-hydroxyacid dehydrogenase
VPGETIGFVGLGKMGEGFTARLMELGHQVLGYDIDADRCREAAARGVKIAASPAAVFATCDVTLVCVISTAAVADVVSGPNGFTSVGATTGKIVVDHSTTELETTKRLARELKERTGAGFVDAPVSGGPNGAAAGKLAIMAGGDQATIDAVRPLMEQLSARFAHMGEVGAGQATKLVNQVLVLANYVVIAEAVNLGKKLGIDVAQIPHALATGHAGGNLLNDLLPRMVERDFAPRGYARQILKDLNLVQHTAGDLPLPMVATATSLYRLLIAQGKSELDGAAIVALLDGSSGTLGDG